MRDPERIIEKNWKLYKMNLIIEKTATDLHHVMGRKYRNKYNVNIDQNKIRISRRDHVDYNNFVKDKQNPRLAIQKLYEMCKSVLRPDIRDIFEELLYNTDDEHFYIPELLKWKKKREKAMSILKKESVGTDYK